MKTHWASILWTFAAIFGLAQVATGDQALNLVTKANLSEVQRIEVFKQVVGGADGLGEATIELLGNITDAATVQKIVSTLDTELPLITRVRCPVDRILMFHRADGSTYSVGYGCEMEGGDFLRGDEAYWYGKDLGAPPELRPLIENAVR
jgi:hypothetical protein